MYNTYANGTTALKMPSSYVLMDAEEMEYVDGGYTFLCNTRHHKQSRSTYARALNVYIALSTVLIATETTMVSTVVKAVGKSSAGSKILAAAKKCTAFMNSNKTAKYITAGLAAAYTVGELIAYALDASDCGGLDGYVEWDD